MSFSIFPSINRDHSRKIQLTFYSNAIYSIREIIFKVVHISLKNWIECIISDTTQIGDKEYFVYYGAIIINQCSITFCKCVSMRPNWILIFNPYNRINIEKREAVLICNVCVLKKTAPSTLLGNFLPTYPSSSFINFVSHLTGGHNSTKFLPQSKNSLSSSCWKHVPPLLRALVSRRFNIHISANSLLKASYAFCIML